MGWHVLGLRRADLQAASPRVWLRWCAWRARRMPRWQCGVTVGSRAGGCAALADGVGAPGSSLTNRTAVSAEIYHVRAEPRLSRGSLTGLGRIWNGEAVPQLAVNFSQWHPPRRTTARSGPDCGAPAVAMPLPGTSGGVVMVPAVATGPGLHAPRVCDATRPGLRGGRSGSRWRSAFRLHLPVRGHGANAATLADGNGGDAVWRGL